jgi:hypothetical protein
MHHGGIAIGESKRRSGDAAVDDHPHHGLASDVHLLLCDGEMVFDGFCRGGRGR